MAFDVAFGRPIKGGLARPYQRNERILPNHIFPLRSSLSATKGGLSATITNSNLKAVLSFLGVPTVPGANTARFRQEGIDIHPQARHAVTEADDIAGASWTKTNCAAAANAEFTGAYTLTSAAAGEAYISRAAANADLSAGCFMKSGTVSTGFLRIGAAKSSAFTLTSSWQYFKFENQTGSTTFNVGFDATAADETIHIAFPTMSNQTWMHGAYYNTTAAAQSPASDILTIPNTIIPAIGQNFSVYIEFGPEFTIGSLRKVWECLGETNARMLSITAAGILEFYYGTAKAVSASAVVKGGSYKVLCVWDGTNLTMYVNGSKQTPVAFGASTLPSGSYTALGVGHTTGSLNVFSGWIRNLKVWNVALPSWAAMG